MSTDNMAYLNKHLPFVTANSAPVTDDLSTMGVAAVLVTVHDPATLERIRTFLVTSYPGQTGGLQSAPQTFGEVASVRAAMYIAVQNAVLLVVVLTLIAAAFSLAIAVTGGIVERKRRNGPFATPSSSITIDHAENFPAVNFVKTRIRSLHGSDSR